MKHLVRYLLYGLVVTLTLTGNRSDALPHQSDNQVVASADDICPVMVGQSIPNVQITTMTGEPFDLHASITQQPTLLIFYRGGWCPFCTVHLAELQSIQADLLELGYQILAISMDRPGSLQESSAEHDLAYTLLSDSAGIATKAFGLAYTATNSNTERLEAASGRAHHILPVPAAFLIGTDGYITFAYINPNYKVRVKSAIILAAAKAAQKDQTKAGR